MKFKFLFFLFILPSLQLNAQIITDKSNHDFGDVKASDSKFVDFKLTNASNTAITIDRFEEPYGTKLRFKSRTIKPDSSTIVRIKYTPKRKGTFSADVPIWVSSNNEPIILSIKGKAVSFDAKEMMEAPEFKQEKKAEQGQLLIEVVEKGTDIPITNAKVDIVWDGVIYQTLTTNDKGLISKVLKKDNYYFIAGANGYAMAETDLELDNDNKVLRIELGPQSGEIIASINEPPDTIVTEPVPEEKGQALQDELPIVKRPLIEDTTKVFSNDTPIEKQPKTETEQKIEIAQKIEPELKAEPDSEQQQVTKVTPEPEPEPETEPKTEPEEEVIKITSKDLPEDKYAPNNIVFLIDISVSMRSSGKLDLLKASMIRMASLLRPSDKLAIVTYSSSTDIALKSTEASNRDKIIQVIRDLEAHGKTAGSKGIKKAYAVLNENHISNGNNQVFISTDGAFNLDKRDKNLLKIVNKNARKGNKISVIGIKNKLWTVKNMEEIARKGLGNYIHIGNYEDAKTVLVEEIKKQSIKR